MRNSILITVCAALLMSCDREQAGARSYEGAPVIIISIDTLRADRLPMYGYAGVQTPHLDAVRRDGILFRNAYSQVPLTLPSHVSILTGLDPSQHKVRNNIGYVAEPSLVTLPGLLKARGYETGAAVSAYVLRASTGVANGFDFYEDAISSRGNTAVGSLYRKGERTAAIASDWIEKRRDKPFFFMLHIFEPHSPYEPAEEFRAAYANAPYDGEIATADRIVGSFIDGLKRSGVYDRAIVILLSDHGEGLGDHGEPEHGIFVYREAIHVPLLVKLPGGERRGETIDAPVGLVDVLPTVAALVGAPAPSNIAGRSLLAAQPANRTIYSESIYARIHLGWSELRSLTGQRFHYISAPRPELYDVRADPAEKTNLIAAERRTYAAMRDELGTRGASVEMPSNIDPEEAKKLAALGYLSSSPGAAAGPLPDPKDRIGEIAAMMNATELLRRRRFDEAIAGFRAIVAQNPRLADGWNQLGTALEDAGRYEEAADTYKRAIEVAPGLSGEFGLRRGSLLLRLERFDEAEQHARLAEKTNAAGMHMLLARVALARKDYRKAEQEARAAAADSGSRLGANVLLAQSYAQQGRLPDALALIEKVAADLEREGSGPVESLHFVRGDILARMERYDEAIAEFRKEIELFPNSRQPYANLYLVLLVTGKPAEANKALEEMVRANPGRLTLLFAARTVEALGDARGAAMWRRRAETTR